MTKLRKVWISTALVSIVMLTSSLFQLASVSAARPTISQGLSGGGPHTPHTATPIKHVIVIIGENHTFDNIFGTFQPLNGQKVFNLSSQGIVNCAGNFGPNVQLAAQQKATDTTTYQLAPQKTGPYTTLPQPNTTYAKGQPPNVPDSRFPANLPNGPYQITRYVPYENSYVGDPLHRFYQMWQEQDKGKHDLYTWVHQTAGDDNGAIPPKPIYQGALDMGYYNMCKGDAPNFNFIGDNYAISDNYHQSVMGGTGANHIMLGTGDAAYYQDAQGNPLTPPANQIENPNPKPGTNNNYTQDGYSGGSYSNCSDSDQPGVASVSPRSAGTPGTLSAYGLAAHRRAQLEMGTARGRAGGAVARASLVPRRCARDAGGRLEEPRTLRRERGSAALLPARARRPRSGRVKAAVGCQIRIGKKP